MNKLVTIGILAFNRPHGLRNTLESICGQSYLNTEILISDNFSTNTEVEQVAREFCSKDSRVKYFRQSENLGPYGNCSFLAHISSGEFFMIASDDDAWDLDYVEKLAKILDENPEAVMSVSDVFYRKGKTVKDFNFQEKMEDKFDQYAQMGTENRVLQHLRSNWDLEGHFIYGIIRSGYAKRAFHEVLKYYSHPIATDLQIVFFLACCGPAVVSRETRKYYYVGETISANFNFNFFEIIRRYSAYRKTVANSKKISGKVKYKAYAIISKRCVSALFQRARESIATQCVNIMKLFRIHGFYRNLKSRMFSG